MPITMDDRARERVATEYVIWLTTSGSDGTPQPRPVWFVWEHDTFLIYSSPNAKKLLHIARNPNVALNFDGGPEGEDIVVFIGTAAVDPGAPPPHQHPAYLAKYRDGITGLDMTPEGFSTAFSTAGRKARTSSFSSGRQRSIPARRRRTSTQLTWPSTATASPG